MGDLLLYVNEMLMSMPDCYVSTSSRENSTTPKLA